MYLRIKGTINVVAITLPINHPSNVAVNSVHGIVSLTTRDIDPHKAPTRLLSMQAKIKNIPRSLFVRSRISSLKYEKAAIGIITCQRSARDHMTFNEKGMSARTPAPIMHPIYAERAPHIPYQMAKIIMKATAK